MNLYGDETFGRSAQATHEMQHGQLPCHLSPPFWYDQQPCYYPQILQNRPTNTQQATCIKQRLIKTLIYQTWGNIWFKLAGFHCSEQWGTENRSNYCPYCCTSAGCQLTYLPNTSDAPCIPVKFSGPANVPPIWQTCVQNTDIHPSVQVISSVYAEISS